MLNNNPIDLSLLRTFLIAAEQNSFLAASTEIGRSASAVSMQIKRLEDHLGRTLFKRDTRNVDLTNDGKKLLNHARRLLSIEAELKAEFTDKPLIGDVTIGVPDDVIERFPMEAVRRFSEQYPNVTVSISVDHTPSLLKAVENKSLDLAIVTYAENIAGIGKAEVIFQEEEVWACRRDGIAQEQTPIPITLWEEGWDWYQPAIEILDGSGMDYRIVLETENITARKSAIEADFAVGPLPRSVLGPNLAPVDKLMALPALPNYALGLVIGDKPKPPIVAVEEQLRSIFQFGFSRTALD